jgi:hypothetical protein
VSTPSGVDIRCPKCGWDPPPFAMERYGRHEADGSWSLVCPADGSVIIENIRYQDQDGTGPRTIDIARELPRRDRRQPGQYAQEHRR